MPARDPIAAFSHTGPDSRCRITSCTSTIRRGGEYEDKFEIAHAAYRLQKSRCFQESAGDLTCGSCHDPHRHLSQDEAQYIAVCLECHQAPSSGLPDDRRHRTLSDCLDCHMPQRRTDDVIHVVMTDHFIRSDQPARDLVAPRSEIVESPDNSFQGEVVLYYPPDLPQTPENALDLAVAQVEAGAQPGGWSAPGSDARWMPISRSVTITISSWPKPTQGREPRGGPRVVEGNGPTEARFLARPPELRKELAKAGEFDQGIEVLQRVLAIRAGDPRALYDMALAYLLGGSPVRGMNTLKRALLADPEDPQAHNLLATQLYAAGDASGAEQEFRQAIRWNPRHAAAHANLASLLAEQGRLDDSEGHFEEAVRFGPDYGKGLLDYGIFLADHRKRFGEAITHLRAAVQLDPDAVPARVGLGYVLSQNGDLEGAIHELQFALAANHPTRVPISTSLACSSARRSSPWRERTTSTLFAWTRRTIWHITGSVQSWPSRETRRRLCSILRPPRKVAIRSCDSSRSKLRRFCSRMSYREPS